MPKPMPNIIVKGDSFNAPPSIQELRGLRGSVGTPLGGAVDNGETTPEYLSKHWMEQTEEGEDPFAKERLEYQTVTTDDILSAMQIALTANPSLIKNPSWQKMLVAISALSLGLAAEMSGVPHQIIESVNNLGNENNLTTLLAKIPILVTAANPLTDAIDETIIDITSGHLDTPSEETTPPPITVKTPYGTVTAGRRYDDRITTNSVIIDTPWATEKEYERPVKILTGGIMSPPLPTSNVEPLILPHLPHSAYEITNVNETIKLQTRTAVLEAVTGQQAGQSSRTLKKDKKNPFARMYVAMLGITNMTFGNLTEVLDFINAFADNVYLPTMQLSVLAHRGPNGKQIKGYTIEIQSGQTLSSLPLKAQVTILRSWMLNPPTNQMTRINRQLQRNIRVDWQGFAIDYMMNQLSDSMIGLTSRFERNLIKATGLHGPLDFGNVTTWLNRYERLVPDTIVTGKR